MPFNMKHNAEVARDYRSLAPLSMVQDAIDLLCEVEKVQTSPGHLIADSHSLLQFGSPFVTHESLLSPLFSCTA